MHTTHTSKSQSQGERYISLEENTRSIQLEIDCLRRRLRHGPDSDPSFDDDEGGSYGPSLGLPSVSLFCMMRTVITNEGVRVHLAKDGVMML